MTVNCMAPNDGTQQTVACVPGIMNVLDLTFTFGNNDLQIMLLDPMTMLPLAGFPMVYPAMPGGQQSVQLFFTGCPSGNVIIQITSPGGMAPFPDMFMLNFAAVSTQQTIQTQLCWDEDYRFGFNGQEKDNEVSGMGNSNTAEFWHYDNRLGRRWNIDPKPNPSFSPYVCFSNNPIWFSDIKGDTSAQEGSSGGSPVYHSTNVPTDVQVQTVLVGTDKTINGAVKEMVGKTTLDEDVGEETMSEGGIFNPSDRGVYKQTVNAELNGTGVFDDDDVDVTIELVGFDFTVKDDNAGVTSGSQSVDGEEVSMGSDIGAEGGGVKAGMSSGYKVVKSTMVSNGVNYNVYTVVMHVKVTVQKEGELPTSRVVQVQGTISTIYDFKVGLDIEAK